MPIKVYIWNFQGKREAWGHASMSLSDGTHISWWPSDGNERKSFKGNAVKAPSEHCMTLDDDINSEYGTEPDVTHTIPTGYINEEAIKIWWQPFSKEENWRVLDQNCSTVVYKALCAGSALSFFPASEKRQYESVSIWTPKSVDKFVQRLIECITGQEEPTSPKQGLGNFAGLMS
ncbi:hypothetical protein CHS0354_014113 [Potamilus streckersoni]|uniref:Uncharacterized protein n=1 Tax=Potamilus streckersoni TaxID=2493646 RepID=A0AAE0TKR5_9BIVA|nr:hypothetical protein CHS0354_014113 [Potamilus streckersoni]